MVDNNKRMVAVSLNQLFNLTTIDHGLVIHRQKIHQCIVVGNVTSIKEECTKTTYTVTDYTAPAMEVVKWGSTSSLNVKEQSYCKIYGQPRKNENNKVYLGKNIKFVYYFNFFLK